MAVWGSEVPRNLKNRWKRKNKSLSCMYAILAYGFWTSQNDGEELW